MRIFKFLFYTFGLFLGITFGFVCNPQYPVKSKLETQPIVLPKTPATAPVPSGDPKVLAGKQLFKTNCAACHNKNMKDDLTGPALKNYKANWENYPKEDLYAWIRNSQALIASGHPQAVKLWKALGTESDE